jgi:hypothetical protein
LVYSVLLFVTPGILYFGGLFVMAKVYNFLETTE